MTEKTRFTFTEPERLAFRRRERIAPSEWAEKYRYVARGPAAGKWRNDFAPYCREPMDTIALPWVRKVVLCWAPQSGKTSVALNFLLYSIDIDPGPAMYILPDEKLAKRVAKKTIIPTIQATPRTAALLSGRAEDVSQLHIGFQNGGDLVIGWASSAAQLASDSVRYLFFDELAKWPEFSGREADALSLAEVRATAYPHTSKELFFSTPNVSGDVFDRVCRHDPDDVRRYFARCPLCGHHQFMDFTRIHWQGCKDHRDILRLKLARYSCEGCGMDWDDHTRSRAVLAGEWRPEKPVERPAAVMFGPLPSWYSPLVSLSKPAAAFVKSKEDRRKLMAFVTQHQAQPWSETVSNKREADVLRRKIALPPGVVPDWAVALTAGIDVQQRGFWFVVRAWDGELTSHLVLYGHLQTFDEVEALVFDTPFPREKEGEPLHIWRAAMDTGGFRGEDPEGLSRTEEIYAFIRERGRGVIFAVKGASRRQFARVMPPRPLERMPRSNKPIPGGLELRMLDTDDLKKLFHWRLSRHDARTDQAGNAVPPEPQRITLHSETGLDYASQILAEELRRTRTGRLEWVAVRADNHLLDAEVYAAACADNSWQPSLVVMSRHWLARRKIQSVSVSAGKTEAHKIEESAPHKESFTAQAIRRRRQTLPGGSWMGGIR